MYNYIRELHRIFNAEPSSPEQRKQAEALQTELKMHLGEEERKLLLRLTDTQGILNYEISLKSFAAGFRLACELACELKSGGSYSFEEAEAKRICRELHRREEG